MPAKRSDNALKRANALMVRVLKVYDVKAAVVDGDPERLTVERPAPLNAEADHQRFASIIHDLRDHLQSAFEETEDAVREIRETAREAQALVAEARMSARYDE